MSFSEGPPPSQRFQILVTGDIEPQVEITESIISDVEKEFPQEVEYELDGAVAGQVETAIHIGVTAIAGATATILLEEVYNYIKEKYKADLLNKNAEGKSGEDNQLNVLLIHVEPDDDVKEIIKHSRRYSENHSLEKFNNDE